MAKTAYEKPVSPAQAERQAIALYKARAGKVFAAAMADMKRRVPAGRGFERYDAASKMRLCEALDAFGDWMLREGQE